MHRQVPTPRAMATSSLCLRAATNPGLPNSLGAWYATSRLRIDSTSPRAAVEGVMNKVSPCSRWLSSKPLSETLLRGGGQTKADEVRWKQF